MIDVVRTIQRPYWSVLELIWRFSAAAPRWTFSVMSAAVAFQMNGVGPWFQWLVQSWIASSSTATLVNVPRRGRRSVYSLNQRSMRLVQPCSIVSPPARAINVNWPTSAMTGRGRR